ncbi:MAG: primosomal protein N' [Actinobacteria bacterium]|nr:primosomal protein N' [Actinomycetota bacterium]
MASPSLIASVIPLVPVWRVDRTFDYRVPADLVGNVRAGVVVGVRFGNRNVRAVVRTVAPGPTAGLEDVARVVIDTPVAAPPMDELLEWVARRYATQRGIVYARVVPPRVRVKVDESRPPTGDPAPATLRTYEGGRDLIDALRHRRPGLWVVRPLANDRTDLLADIVASAARAGPCIVAVPEVRYGSAVLDGIHRRVGDLRRVDSSRSEGERSAAWVASARGHRAIGGGRASVLVPTPDLAAIVLDEEHHPTFKEDRSPRYDARRVALRRASLQNASCVLVSPTPSLDIASDPNRAVKWVQPSRDAARAARPVVELVAPPSDWFLSGELQQRMRRTLQDGARVGLLVPRGGFARAVWCASCRRSLRCERCEAGMSFDRSAGALRCPRCGLEHPLPPRCPHCGADELILMGAGSQKIADQLRRAFPRARVARVDPDSLADGELPDPGAQIYVTTWIGTKEALRPDVRLVGVLDADALIRRPDFRSAETAYQALWEMAAWAGPAGEGGRLLIQTADPTHHAVQAVVRADHAFFAERELESRRELGYPPFSELVRVRALGDGREGWIGRAASAAAEEGGQVMGPITTRMRGGAGMTEAREVLIKCPDGQAVAERLRDILASMPAGARLQVDVDPR